jgi:beta-lactamase class A
LRRILLTWLLLVSLAGEFVIETAKAQTDPHGNTCGSIDLELLNAPSVFRYGLSAEELQEQFFGDDDDKDDGSFHDAGYRPMRLTGYTKKGEVRFGTRWVKQAGPERISSVGMTMDQFDARYSKLRSNYRIVDISAYNTPDGPRYADIWEENPSGAGWAVTSRATAAQLNVFQANMKSQGFAPTRIEGFTFGGSTRFATVWTKVRNCDWEMQFDLTGDAYEALVAANYPFTRLIHLDSYQGEGESQTAGGATEGPGTRYAGIWWDQSGPTLSISNGYHWYSFQRLLNNNECYGYTFDNFYIDEGSDDWNYFGGLWSYRAPPAVTDRSSLTTRVDHHMNCAEGRAGAAILNATTGESVMIHADQLYGTASSSKAFILYALLRMADDLKLDLTSEEIDDTPIIDLATAMIQVSSNSAANTLIDYVGVNRINEELHETLGLSHSRIERHLTGGSSLYGPGTWFDDFKNGYDNFSTPRELATFYQKIWDNDEARLSNSARNLFFAITDLPNSVMNNVLNEQVPGYDPLSVQISNKPGAKTYSGVPGDFEHRPQLGNHRVTADAGVMNFTNGQRVFFAVIVDAGDADATYRAISCTGWEIGKDFGGQPVGDPADCAYP